MCCKGRQKSSWPVTGLRNRESLEVLNDIKLILNDLGGHSCSFRTNLVSFRTFRYPLFLIPVTGHELFFAVSYSKPALGSGCQFDNCVFRCDLAYANWKCQIVKMCDMRPVLLVSTRHTSNTQSWGCFWKKKFDESKAEELSYLILVWLPWSGKPASLRAFLHLDTKWEEKETMVVRPKYCRFAVHNGFISFLISIYIFLQLTISQFSNHHSMKKSSISCH